MPDADEQIEATAPEPTPTPDSATDATTEASESAAEQATEAAPKPEPKYATWQDALKDADPDELLKLPEIAGKIGGLAQKQAREIAAREEERRKADAQIERDRAEEERLRELRRTDTAAYAEEMDKRDASADAIREEARRQAALAGDVTGRLTEMVQEQFPKEAIEQLAGKTYPGTYAEGVAAYWKELTEVSRQTLRAQWEKDERPALRKQVLAELNGGEDQSVAPVATGRHAGPQFNSALEASTAFYEGQIDMNAYRAIIVQHPDWR